MPVEPSIASQLHAMGQALPVFTRQRFYQTFRPMCLDIAAVLEEKIEHDVFRRQSEPSGKAWQRIAPLTVAVRKGTGKGGGSRLGGKALPDSFKKGGRGNLLKIRAKLGFEFGSRLRAKSHLVGATFATHFKMPRDIDKAAVVRKASGKRGVVKEMKSAKRRLMNKGAKIRGFMLSVAGVGAPAPGQQLTHPARTLVYWTPAWEKACSPTIQRYLTVALHKASKDATRAARQAALSSMHRPSVVG